MLYFIQEVNHQVSDEFSTAKAVASPVKSIITSGAELEFLPLTEFPLYRLSTKVKKALKEVYNLSKSKKDSLISRQPQITCLIQMLVTVGLINHYAHKQHPKNHKYQAKLNHYNYLKIKNSLVTKAEGKDYNQAKNVLAIFSRFEELELIQSEGENILNVGLDGSVHGTNAENISYYEKLYKDKKDNRFNFKLYSGQEIGFPVCESIEETISLYNFVVSVLKKRGVHFTTTSGVHLHVGIEKKDVHDTQNHNQNGTQNISVEEVIDHLGNVTSAVAAACQVINDILPPTRQNNIYAMPFGDKVDEHIAHHKKAMTKLEYIQKKIDMIKIGVKSDPDLMADKDAAMYEFILGVTYGIAPIQHEYNYKSILQINTKSAQEFSRKASIVVRNTRYTSINITPLLKESSLPTYEWRVLPSTLDVEIQSKLFKFLYRIIASQQECIATRLYRDFETNQEYISFLYKDGYIKRMENSLSNWLEFTECVDLFHENDFAKLRNQAYWASYDAANDEYINLEENTNWAEGQFYTAPKFDNPKFDNSILDNPILDIYKNPSLEELMTTSLDTLDYQQQDLAILDFLNHAFNIQTE